MGYDKQNCIILKDNVNFDVDRLCAHQELEDVRYFQSSAIFVSTREYISIQTL